MTTTVTGGGQICPNCGHRNTDTAAFCAECGTRLEASEPDAQATAAFSPVTSPSGSTDPASTWNTGDDAYATQEFTPATTVSEPARNASDWYPTPIATTPPPESRRGFVLGVIAAILILLVIGFFAWSTLVSQGFRDSVTGIF